MPAHRGQAMGHYMNPQMQAAHGMHPMYSPNSNCDSSSSEDFDKLSGASNTVRGAVPDGLASNRKFFQHFLHALYTRALL